MAGRRTIATAAAALTVAAVASGVVAMATRDDPRIRVEAVSVGGTEVSVPTEPGGAAGEGSQQVAALDPIEGTLVQRGDDADEFYVGSVELEFGPEAWVLTAGPGEDFDGDGAAENLLDELEGLVGESVSALVRLDDDGDDADVFVLNDLAYRDSAGGPAPWHQTGNATGDAASPQAVAEAAAAAVGGGARVRELDREIVGDVAWEAEVIAADGREHTVLLDATGEVLDARLDD